MYQDNRPYGQQHAPGWAPGPAPRTGMSGASVVLVAVVAVLSTLLLVALAFLVVPQLTSATPAVVPAAAPVVPAPAGSRAVTGTVDAAGTGIYSCGSANGYAIEVLEGNVPCSSAQWVTTMWTTDGTTPGGGAGPSGTPYSWTCTEGTTTAGLCTSAMGSRFTIS